MVRSKHRQLLVGYSLFLLWPSFYKREREKHRNQSNSPLENLGSDSRALEEQGVGHPGSQFSPYRPRRRSCGFFFRPPRAPASARALPSVVSVSVGWPPYSREPGPAGICPPPLGQIPADSSPGSRWPGFESWFLALRSASSPYELLFGMCALM